MGCCWSNEDDRRFEDRDALLAKTQTENGDVHKAKFQAAANGHYTKPKLATEPPSIAKDKAITKEKEKEKGACCGGCASNGKDTPKKTLEEVHPTVKTVDLLKFDQPPSPPASQSVSPTPSPAKPVQSPRRSASITVGEAEDEEDEDKVLLSLQKRLSKKLTQKDMVAESPPAKEPLSHLMPPRPSPPPEVLKAMKEAEAKAKEAEAKHKANANASMMARTSVTSTDSTDDNDDGDNGEASTASGSGSNNLSKTKSSKKKKKKGKK